MICIKSGLLLQWKGRDGYNECGLVETSAKLNGQLSLFALAWCATLVGPDRYNLRPLRFRLASVVAWFFSHDKLPSTNNRLSLSLRRYPLPSRLIKGTWDSNTCKKKADASINPHSFLSAIYSAFCRLFIPHIAHETKGGVYDCLP